MLSRKKTWGLVTGGAGLGLLVGFLLAWSYQPTFVSAPQSALQPSSGKIQIMLDYGDGNVQSFEQSVSGESVSALEALKLAAETQNIPLETKDYPGMGTLVTKIGGKEGGDGNRYWQYWVNNQNPVVGAQATLVRPGDWMEWKFMPFISR